MHALLFDRRSLTLTGVALAGIGALLFAAGFVLGVTVSRERELVAPRWVEYGPLPPDAARLETPTAAPLASPAAATIITPADEPAVESGGADGGWVPFARPGEVEALMAREIEEPEPAAPADRIASRTARAESSSAPTPDRATGVPTSDAGAERVRTTEEASPAAAGARSGSWYVQTGAFSVPDYARAAERELESRFADRPYAPYLEEITDRRGRRLLTVRLGPFPSRDEADAVAADFDDVLVRHTTSNL